MPARPGPAPGHCEPLARHHERAGFDCGVEALDAYLRSQASQDQRRKVAACYVLVSPEAPTRIRGYYTLSTYGIRLSGLPAETRKRLPRYPEVPAALIGRLAVDRRDQGRGLGEFLLMDALARVLEIEREIGVFAVVVNARNPAAAEFYRRYEFIPFPSEPLRLFLPVATIAAAFASK